MKADTVVMMTKGCAFVIAGAASSLVAGLGQWANTGEWPERINWVVIIAGTVGGAATQLLSFLSGSYMDWQAKRQNGTTTITK